MAQQADRVATAGMTDEERTVPTVSAHEVTPMRTVFTEADNTDGWIATDVTVDLTD